MKHGERFRDTARTPFPIVDDQFGNALWAGPEDPFSLDGLPSTEMRVRVLRIAASAGSDEAQTREWVTQRYGRTLEQLEDSSLADAVAVLSRGLDRRNGAQAA